MRPILTTDEIKKVFSLAFNEINDRTDDIISWEDAYKLFAEMQKDSLETFLATSSDNEKKLDAIVDELNLEDNKEERIRTFLLVVQIIGNVGFPIAISVYLLMRIEGKLEVLSNSINNLSNVMSKIEK